MEKDLRKRLEKAAHESSMGELIFGREVSCWIGGFKEGGEWMYNECGGITVLHDMRRLILAQCKAWLKEHYHLFDHFDKEEVIADFETDMNKLWEE